MQTASSSVSRENSMQPASSSICRETSMQMAPSFPLCLHLEAEELLQLHGELYEGRVAATAEEECVSYNFLMENRSRG